MRVKLCLIAAVVACLWVAGGLTSAIRAAPPEQGPAPGEIPTPQLIEAARARGDIDQETAYLYLAYALGDYEKLPPEYRSQVPWDGTLPLLHLRQAARTLRAGPALQEIVVILSGSCGSSVGSLPTILNSTHFHIEYGSILGGLNINNYVTSLEATWSQEVTSFGWAAPPVFNSNPPPGSRYHVRVDNLGSGLYGYVTNSGVHTGLVGNNPNTAWNEGDAYATCMVLNRDYSGFPGTPQKALDATTAHEFNHSIQFGYGALTGANAPDDSFVEGGATWMEDEVHDAANDNYNYLWPTFSMCMGQYTASPYPYWITFRGLTERYGAGTAGGGEQVMQNFWETTSQSPSSNMLNAMNSALVSKGTSLGDAYHAYAVAVKFNKTCGGGYVYPYCFEEAAGYVGMAGPTSVHGSIAAVGGSTTGSLADNYALNWISLPNGSSPYNVTLQNTSAGGQLRGSVVCDTGSALNVLTLPAVVGPGGSATLTNFNPSGCSSVVAVLTNQSQTAANPLSCTARSYQLRTESGTEMTFFLPIVFKNASGGAVGNGGTVNGDFESGPPGWNQFSTHRWDLIVTSFSAGVTPHSGSWAVWLGGDDDEISYIQQQVTVPTSSPYLAYWYWIASEDDCGFDFGKVIVNGAIVVDVYDLCLPEDTGGWVKHVVNLSAYAGQSVSLQIRAETDVSLNSNLFVDDVSFQASAFAMQAGQGRSDPQTVRTKSGRVTSPQEREALLEEK